MKRQNKAHHDNIKYQHSIEKQLDIVKHGERVSLYSILLGKLLKTDETTQQKLKIAAREHDAGKILCPPHILYKPGPLTEKERVVIQLHSKNSAVLYAENYSESIDIDIARAIRGHHENYDGSGYPDGLIGANIPFISRIIRITDTFDTLTQERCYKKAISCEEALGEILRTHIYYDPDMLMLFAESFEDFVTLFNTLDELVDIKDIL